VGQHPRIETAKNENAIIFGVGQHKTEWWVNMKQNLHPALKTRVSIYAPARKKPGAEYTILFSGIHAPEIKRSMPIDALFRGRGIYWRRRHYANVYADQR